MGRLRAPLPGQRPLAIVMTAALAMVPAAVRAKQVETTAIVLNATVKDSCKTFAIPLLFGTLPTANFKVDKNSVIHLTCTPNMVVTVMIDDGQNVGGGSRRMKLQAGGGPRFLPYELYSDAAQTKRWGGTLATGVKATIPASGARVSLPVYGHTEGNVKSGPYLDTVTVTIDA